MTASEFDANFKALTGHDPFPWQRRLFETLSAGKLPEGVDIPTRLGKTAVMALWLPALRRVIGANVKTTFRIYPEASA